jgi:hypothetical protein
MALNVVSFADRISRHCGWSNEEFAELYRVEHALSQTGIPLETDYGITDEGDPWFVFCRCEGEVLVHIARYDGLYRLCSPALPQPLTGLSFTALTKSFVSGLRAPVQQSAGVSIHPAALLSVLVAAIFYAFDFHSNPGHAENASLVFEREVRSSDLLHEDRTGDALSHTFVDSVSAFCNRTSEAVSSILTKVEAAAAAVAITVAVLADRGHADSRADSDADSAAANAVADHQDRSTDRTIVADLAPAPEQHHANADDSAPSQIMAAFGDLTELAPDAVQALPIPPAVAALQGAVGNDNAPSAGSNPAQSENADAASTQLDGSTWAALANEITVAFAAASSLHNNGPADSLPVTLTEPQADNQDGSHHSVDLTLAGGDAASLSGNQNVGAVNISLASGGGSVDLSAAGGVDVITVAGDGSLLIAGIASSGSPEIIIAPHFDVSLTFGTGSADTTPVIRLSGLDQLSLTDAPGASLTLDSEGSGTNRVAIGDAAVSGGAALNLTVAGTQNLMLQESAAAFDSTFFNTSTYSGSLTIALDLENTSQSLDLSKVSAANYILTDGVASVDAANGAQIQLGNNLNIVEVSVAGTTTSAPGTLLFDLGGGSGQPGLGFVNLLEPLLTSDVVLNSGGAGAGANTVRMLSDSTLALLTLTGDSALTIGAIEGPTATDSQNITINARDLSGALALDVSDILDTAAGGRSIIVIGGSGSNVLTNLTATESTNFILGPGQNTINIGAGSVSDSVGGLTSSTAINIGSAGYADIIVNELNAGTKQVSIDGQTSLIAAAQAAWGLAGSSIAHEAVLFTYQGAEYAFIDASGSQIFDSGDDAIIKLTGIPAKADLAGVFHSA